MENTRLAEDLATDQAPCSAFTASQIERLFESPFSAVTSIQLLWKGDESFTTIIDALMRARRMICLQFYIFRNDETGSAVAEALKKKATEGIAVYVLYDHFGSIGTPRSFWRDLARSGVRIAASRPFKWTAPCRYVHRDHRKLIVVDSERAFTGGLNIANEYSGFHLRRRGSGWRDTGIIVEGPIAGRLLRTFRKSWYAWTREVIAIDESADPHAPAGLPAIPLFVDSGKGRRRLRRLLYYSINRAERSITLTTAYFTPSRRMVETLENAVTRGVRVQLLVPGMSDVPAASYAGMASFTRLLKAGVEIYRYTGEILHAKTYIFDECWSIIGSTNLDFQSLRYNDEGNVGILDHELGAAMTRIFNEDLTRSTKTDLAQWRMRPLGEKLKEHFFSLFRRRL
jgi:cardiolipin synthase